VDTSSLPLVGSPSDRVRLAQVAREVALAAAGVADLDAGPAGTFCTAGAAHRVAGVTCTASPDGGFDLSLRLVCELVPLHAVANRVRRRIQTAAGHQQLEVASITILIANVVEPGVQA
jgi:hypothetical protein